MNNSSYKVQTYKLSQLLHSLFSQQAREVATRVSVLKPVPDLTHWQGIISQAVQPLILQHYQQGLLSSRSLPQFLSRYSRSTLGWRDSLGRKHEFEPEDIFIREGLQPSSKEVMYSEPAGRLYTSRYLSVIKGRKKTKTSSPRIEVDWNAINPRIIAAVDELTLSFCRETLATARTELDDTLARLRRALKKGLTKNKARELLVRSVKRIFADPYRAARIAVTETARATMMGRMFSAKESGVVSKKKWLVSPKSCPSCQQLNGKTVALDRPFYVDPSGGHYAIVQFPPLHPFCNCEFIEVI